MTISEDLLNCMRCMLSSDGHICNDPIILNCGGQACKSCLQAELKCLNCKTIHNTTSIQNPTVNLLIETYKNDLILNLNQNIRFLMQKILDNHLDNLVHEKIDEISFNIDIRIESLINELHKHRDKLFNELSKFKENIKKKLDQEELKQKLGKIINIEPRIKKEKFYEIQNKYHECESIYEKMEKSLGNRLKIVCFKQSEFDLECVKHVGELFGLNVKNHKPIYSFEGHISSINCLEHLDSGELLSGSSDKSIKMWNLTDKSCISTMLNDDSIICMLKIGNGEFLTGSWDGEVKIWSMIEKKPISKFNAHKTGINCFLQLSNGDVCSGSWDNSLKIWNILSKECLAILEGHKNSVTSIIEWDDNLLVSGSYDKTIKVWTLKTKRCLATLQEHADNVVSLVNLKNSLVASGSADKTIKIWNIKKLSCIMTFEGHTANVSCLAYLDNNLFASGAFDGTIKIWDLDRKECIQTLNGHTDSVKCLKQLNNGTLISASADKTIKIWEILFNSFD